MPIDLEYIKYVLLCHKFALNNRVHNLIHAMPIDLEVHQIYSLCHKVPYIHDFTHIYMMSVYLFIDRRFVSFHNSIFVLMQLRKFPKLRSFHTQFQL